LAAALTTALSGAVLVGLLAGHLRRWWNTRRVDPSERPPRPHRPVWARVALWVLGVAIVFWSIMTATAMLIGRYCPTEPAPTCPVQQGASSLVLVSVVLILVAVFELVRRRWPNKARV
jgi:hypothetical protein